MVTRRKFLSLGIGAALAVPAMPALFGRAWAAEAGPFDFYISPDGSDENSGTLSSPWSITALQSKSSMIAGKHIGLASGTYICTAFATGGNDGGLQVTADGVTIEAIAERAAIITTDNNGNYPQSTSPAFNVTGNGVVFRNIAFHKFSFSPIRVNGDDQTYEGCDFFDSDYRRVAGYSVNDNNGFVFYGGNKPNRTTFRNCRFERTRNGNSVMNYNNCCLGPLYYGQNTVVEQCSFYDSGSALGWKGFTLGGLVISGCYFDKSLMRNGILGLQSDGQIGEPHIVDNSIFNDCGYAFDCWQANEPETEAVMKVRNCTFIVSQKAQQYGIGVAGLNNCSHKMSSDHFNQSEWFNNIVHFKSGNAPIFHLYPGSTPQQLFGVIDYNLYSKIDFQDLTSGGSRFTTLAQWRSRLSNGAVTGQEAHSLVDAPLFVNANGSNADDFKLLSGSPGKSDGRLNGVNTGQPTEMGAWGGGAGQVGCNFGARPVPPDLSVS